MTFYEMCPRQGYAGYWPEITEGEVSDLRIPPSFRKMESSLREYLGNPPRKTAGRRGVFHKSAYSFFVRGDALDFFRKSAKGGMIARSVRVIDREGEDFSQVWITNFVDCLDLERTTTSKPIREMPRKIGVIKRPMFDVAKWDGSDLFVVPQDPSYCLFVSQNFVDNWTTMKFKGAQFCRYLMDPEPIKA